jgi:hypothetical protein
VTRGSCADGAETVTGSAQTEIARRATRNRASTRGISHIDDTNDLRKVHACRRWVGVPAAHCMLAGARDFVTKSEHFAFGGHQRGPSLLPSPTPSAPTPVAMPPTAGFEPSSVTFVSLEMGWALGDAPCAGGTCLALRRTVDGGRSWTTANPPPTPFSLASPVNQGVSQIRFADPLDGWAFGPDLWSTHDGGAQWAKSSLTYVGALEAGAGRVHAASIDGPTNGSYNIETSVTTRDAWVRTGSLQLGAGPVPAPDLVLQGSTGWAVENDRAVVDGARLVSGRWRWPRWWSGCLRKWTTLLPDRFGQPGRPATSVARENGGNGVGGLMSRRRVHREGLQGLGCPFLRDPRATWNAKRLALS